MGQGGFQAGGRWQAGLCPPSLISGLTLAMSQSSQWGIGVVALPFTGNK